MPLANLPPSSYLSAMAYPDRHLTFRPDDLDAAAAHPFGCFALQPHDAIQRACNAFTALKGLPPYQVFIQPRSRQDDCYISMDGAPQLGLPPRSLVVSAGALAYYRGWEQAANFAHEFAHPLGAGAIDEFSADLIATDLIGKAPVLSWLASMGDRHGLYANGDHPSFNRRIAMLRDGIDPAAR